MKTSPHVLALAIAICVCLSGCDEQRRARRSGPIPRLPIIHDTNAPIALFSSRVDSLPPSRPSTVLIEVVATAPLVGLGTEISGHEGLNVQGGKRLNHGAAGRGRAVKRTLMVEADPNSKGHLHVELSWKKDLQTIEQRVVVEIELHALTASP